MKKIIYSNNMTMKTTTTNTFNSIITILLFSVSYIAYSQQHHSKEDFEKIEAAKIAHITQQTSLTPQQAEDFWPLYNEYSEKRRALKHERKELMHQSETVSDDKEILKSMTRMDELREMEIALDKAYRKKFLLILSPNQVMKLYKAEKEFYRMIMKKLHEED